MKKWKIISWLLVSGLLVGCNANDIGTEGTDISQSDFESIVESTSVEKTVQSSEKLEDITYQSIFDEYSEKLITTAPQLVDEYNKEYPTLNNDVVKLAELSYEKIEILALILSDGITGMAELQLVTQSEYSEYEEWAGKLSDVYTEEATKITDAYFAAAMPLEQEEPAVEQPESTYEQPTQEVIQESEPAPVYATVQPGESPQQVADRAGITLDEIVRLNNIDLNNYMLMPGDQLRVK